MKLNTTDFPRKMQHPLVLALACFPLVLFLLAKNAPEALGTMWVLPAAYVLLAWACLLAPGKLRLPCGVIGICAMAAATVSVWPVKEHPVLLLLIVVYAVLTLFILPVGRWERGRELGVEWHVIGILSHVLVQLLINGAKKLGDTSFDSSGGVLVGSFLALAVLLVLGMNRQSLQSASQARQNVPLLMRRQNLVLVMGALVIGVLIAMIPAIGEGLAWAWDMLMRFLLMIGSLIAAIMPENRSGGSPAPGDAGDSFGMGAANEPSPLLLLMEKLLGVLTVIILVVGMFFFLRMLGKRLVKLLRYLWEKLGKYSAAVSEDYEDEVTSTREEDTERESLLSRLRRFVPEDECGLDPTQRVRSRYRGLKRRRPQWTQASTARETLPEEAASLYERARYGGETLTEADAERFRDATKKV